MIIIQASNIHNGGGAVLLRELISSIIQQGMQSRIYVDSRFKFSSEIKSHVKIICVAPSILSRLKAEWLIKKDTLQFKNANVLFFGNLPPLFKLKCQTFLFFQNVLMLSDGKKINSKFNFKTQLKQKIEQFWLRNKISNIDTVLVQSESVKKMFLNDFSDSLILVKPFAEIVQSKSKSKASTKYDFIYVASGDPHKNHIHLLKAFLILSNSSICPKLLLVVQQLNEDCVKLIEKINVNGGQVILNQSVQNHDQVLQFYAESTALIYPSLAESFGLPLLEAKAFGLPIIASELDYVRDIVEPIETFDPNSELSIARAVQRFLKSPQSLKTEISTPTEFLQTLLKS